MSMHYVVVQHRGSLGVLAGILGCIFGILGIFTFGIVFVPLAIVCSIFGLLRGIFGGSIPGIGTSILAAALGIFGFIFSPSLWILLNHMTPTNTPSVQPNALDRAAEREKTLNSFAANVQQLISRMEKFNVAADGVAPKLSAAQQKYQSITSKIGEYYEHQRDLSANPDTFTIRNQIYIAIIQGMNTSDQLHNQVLSGQMEFENKIVPLMKQVVEAEQSCNRLQPQDSGQATAANKLAFSVCHTFANSVVPFKQKYNTLASGYARLEDEYQNEIRRQHQIEQASAQIH